MAKAKKPKKFIQEAIEHPGALTRKAKQAGMSIQAYCEQNDLTTQSKRQCNLAKTLRRLPRRGE